MMVVRLGVAVAAGVLRGFRAAYPERFKLSGLDERLEQIVAGLNTVFRDFGRRTA